MFMIGMSAIVAERNTSSSRIPDSSATGLVKVFGGDFRAPLETVATLGARANDGPRDLPFYAWVYLLAAGGCTEVCDSRDSSIIDSPCSVHERSTEHPGVKTSNSR
jgi:hypothetical protein